MTPYTLNVVDSPGWHMLQTQICAISCLASREYQEGAWRRADASVGVLLYDTIWYDLHPTDDITAFSRKVVLAMPVGLPEQERVLYRALRVISVYAPPRGPLGHTAHIAMLDDPEWPRVVSAAKRALRALHALFVANGLLSPHFHDSPDALGEPPAPEHDLPIHADADDGPRTTPALDAPADVDPLAWAKLMDQIDYLGLLALPEYHDRVWRHGHNQPCVTSLDEIRTVLPAWEAILEPSRSVLNALSTLSPTDDRALRDALLTIARYREPRTRFHRTDYAALLADPRWPEVVAAAQRALDTLRRVFAANGLDQHRIDQAFDWNDD